MGEAAEKPISVMWADLDDLFNDENETVPTEEVFDRVVARQAEQFGDDLSEPCSEAQELLKIWSEDLGRDCLPMWRAAVARSQPGIREVGKEINDATLIGDQHSPEAQTALATPIAIMHAPTRLTPGNKWVLLEETVGGMIQNYLSWHPVTGEKDGRAVVYAQGANGLRQTVSGIAIQHGYRVQDKIKAITAFAADVDGTDKARRVADRIHDLGYMGLVYTTYSQHAKRTADGDRFRVIIFLDEPFTLPVDAPEARRKAVAEWQSRYAGMCELLRLEEIDGTGLNLHQMQYTPRRASADADYEHYIIAGRALRIEDMPLGDASKYRKKGPARGAGKTLSPKDHDGNQRRLSDGFDVAEWYFDVGRFILFSDLLDMIGWDVRGEASNGWKTVQCPNHAQHSDPEDDEAGLIESENGFAVHCFHDHCANLNTLEFVVLIEKAILAGEAVLPDGIETLSALLCDPSFYPNEIDGEPVELDPSDYGVEEVITLEWLSNARKVERAFKNVTENNNAGDDHYAALYGGAKKAGNKTKAVEKLDVLMKTCARFERNDRKRLEKRGSDMLEEERKTYAAEKDVERRREVEKAMEKADPANLSMDPAEPLGDDLETALATLRFRFVIANIAGKFRIVRKPDLTAFGSELNSTIEVFTKTDFTDFYANQSVGEGEDRVFPAKKFLELEKRKSGLVFAPPPLMPGSNDFNMYMGRKLEPKEGAWPTLERFIREVVCDGDDAKYEWLMLWMAHMVQFPGEKPGTGVIATGTGGIGKGTMGMLLMRLAAPHSMQIENETHVVGQFAGEHLSKCILVVVNEALFGKSSKVSSILKALFDSKTMQVEAKGMSLFTAASFTRYYVDSNDAVPVLIENNGSERRYFVLQFRDVMQGDKEYFNEVHAAINGDEMQALLAYLEEYEPPASAGLTWDDVRTAPETPERVKMGVKSMGPALHRLRETLIEGEVTLSTSEGLETFTANENGFRVPQALFRDYIAAAGDKRDTEDRDVLGMFAQLFPEAEVVSKQGKVGGLDDTRWWQFPPEVIGESAHGDD